MAFGGWFKINANPKNLKVVSGTRGSVIGLEGCGTGEWQILLG